jgi:hypothetical protein
VNRHQFLRRLHEVYQPRTYFEIGVHDGRSLALSRVATVAVDPAHRITSELRCDLHLVKATSDDFFAREEPFEHLAGVPIDLVFIDGMHLLEYVLRDFINTEKHADWSTVVVLDDQLPRNVDEAARDRHTTAWAGDVYKIIAVLQRYRPELRLAVLDTQPTGVMAVFGLDPSNTVLADRYDEIMDRFLLKDPQQVPAEMISRSCAMDPDTLLSASFWPTLRAARDRQAAAGGAPIAPEAAFAEIDKLLADQPRPQLRDWLPDPGAGRDQEFDDSVSIGELAMLQAVRAKAAAKQRGKASGRNDAIARLARRAPFLKKVPGARAFARAMRR